jgi:peptidoglycan/LPS O-acetylase OafA/YrhL
MSFDGLLFGSLCACLYRNARVQSFMKKKSVSNSMFFTGLFAVLIVGLPQPLVDTDVSFFNLTFMPTVISAGFALMLLGLMSDCWASPAFCLKIWFPIALVSYSLYLVHLPLLPATIGIANVLFPFGEPVSALRFLTFLPVYIIVTGLVAGLLYRFVEKPLIDYSHKPAKSKE